jgi:hypothetical protein
MKQCAVIVMLWSLTACANLMINPYEKLPRSQLASLSIQQLCHSAHRYKFSTVIDQEIAKRGYKDCSESELYCQDNLGLKPRTQAYIHCRMQRDQHNLQEKALYLNYLEATQPQQFDVNVYHSDW